MDEKRFPIAVQRWLKVALALSVAIWGAVGALGNVLDWPGTYGAVEAVISMNQFEGGASDWRSTDNALVVTVGAVSVPLFKSICAFLAFAGAWAMWHSRRGDADTFAQAKSYAVSACMVAVLGLFLGWIVIGEGWFEMWRDGVPTGLEAAGDAAFRYGGFIGIIGVLIALRESRVDFAIET